DGLKDKQCVFDSARHGAELVERPAEGHRASSWDAAEGGTQPGDAATHAGTDDAATGFAADGKAHEARSSGCAGAGAGAGGALFEKPGIYRLSAEPNIIQGESAEAELREEDRTRGVEALYDGSVFRGNTIAI